MELDRERGELAKIARNRGKVLGFTVTDRRPAGVELLAQSNPKVTAILDAILEKRRELEMLRAAAWAASQ